MAADPTLRPTGQLGGQDEDQFDRRTFLHGAICVKEYAIGADVTGFGGDFHGGWRGADANRDARRDALLKATLGIRNHDE